MPVLTVSAPLTQVPNGIPVEVTLIAKLGVGMGNQMCAASVGLGWRGTPGASCSFDPVALAVRATTDTWTRLLASLHIYRMRMRGEKRARC